MPQFAVAAVAAIKTAGAYVAAASTAAAAGTATLAQTAALVAVNVAASAAISAGMALLQPKVGVAGNPTDWTANPDAPLAFAAGRVGVGGTIVHRDEYGPNNMYQTLVTVLSNAGPIKSILSYKGDDQAVTFGANGAATSSQWVGEMWQQNRLGNQPETAHTSPTGLTSGATLPGWGASDRISGAASVMMTLSENSKRTAYPTGEPKSLWTIEGLYAYDPRLDSTYPGGFGACRLNNPASWVWTENPILWALKWKLGLWEGPTGKGAPGVDYQVGGIGMPIDAIRVDQYVEAANLSDLNGWTVSAWPTTDDDKIQVLDGFLQAGGAIYCSSGGKAGCIHRAGPRVSVATITRADTTGPIELATTASRISRINTIRPRFLSEADGWKMVALPEVTAASYVTEDGEKKRTRGVDFPYVRNANQAAQLAALQIANTRESQAGNVPLRAYYQNLLPGDAITIDEPGFVLNGAKLLILDTDYNAEDGTHKIVFLSETDAKYPFALGQTTTAPVLPALTPATPTVITPPAPGEWALSEETFVGGGASVPALVFSGSVANARAQAVLFEFRVQGEADWTAATSEDPTVIRKEVTGVTNETIYEGAVSYRANGNVSTRLVLGPVTTGVRPPIVAGDFDTTPPAIPTGLNLTSQTVIANDGTAVVMVLADWADNTEADLAGYDIDWYEGGALRASRRVSGSHDTYTGRAGLAYAAYVRAVDRLGNASGYTLDDVTTEGDATAPGAITSPTLTPLARRIVLQWVGPTDDDFSHIRLHRDTDGSFTTVTTFPEVRGSIFADTSVVAGQIYYYWAQTVDRTGNIGALTYLGSATPVFISVGGGDVETGDVNLHTQYGMAATYSGQTAWGTYSGSTNRLQYMSDAGLLDDLTRVTNRPFTALSARTADNLTYISGGATVESLRPGEAGANVTESRTAAAISGQTRFATASSLSIADGDIAAPWSAVDSRPALTQGNSLTEDPALADPSAWNGASGSGTFVTITDGEVATTAFRGTGGTFYSARHVPVDDAKTYLLEGWYRRTGTTNTAYGLVDLLDGSGNRIGQDGTFFAYEPVGYTIPATWTYYSRIFGAGTGKPIPSNARQMAVGALPNYNGAAGAVEIQGLRIIEVIRVGGSLYRADGSLATEAALVTSLGQAATISGQGPGATATANDVLNNRAEGSAALVPAPVGGSAYIGVVTGAIKITLPQWYKTGFMRFSVDIYTYDTGAVQTYNVGGHDDLWSASWHNVFASYIGPEPLSRTVRFGNDGTNACLWIGETDSGWYYATVHVRDFVQALRPVAEYDDGWGVTIVTSFGNVQRAVTRPRAGDQVFGEGLFETSGGVVATRAAFRTDQGQAATIAGQGPGATALSNRVMNDRYEGGVKLVRQPDGGQLNISAGDQVGQIEIVLPFAWNAASPMITMDVVIHTYGQGRTNTYTVAGHHYSTGSYGWWINTTATFDGPRDFARTVKFGYNAAGKACIWIGSPGDLWQYPNVTIRDVQIGHASQANDWATGWVVQLNNATIGGYVNTTTPYYASLIATPRNGDQVFGEGLLEQPGGAVATRAAFRTDQGQAATIAGQGALATANSVNHRTQVTYKPAVDEQNIKFNFANASEAGTAGHDIGTPSVVTFVSTSENTGKAMQVGDNSGNDYTHWFGPDWTPYNPTDLYEIVFDIDIQATHASNIIYLGVQGLDRAGNNLGGSYNYLVLVGTSQSSILGRRTFKGYFTGWTTNTWSGQSSDPLNPVGMPDGTNNGYGQGGVVQFRPMALFNYNNYNGQIIVHSVRVNRLSGAVSTQKEICYDNGYLKETAGGTVATLGNFKTNQGVAASYSGQTPLATQVFPTYNGVAAAKAAGLADGRQFYDSSNSNLLTAVTSAAGGFGATANATSRSGSTTSGSVTTSTVTVTPTGASGAVTYEWYRTSGDASITATSPTGASTAFTGSVAAGEIKNASFACAVKDAGSGKTITLLCNAVLISTI